MKNKNFFTFNQTLKNSQKKILNKYVSYQKIRFSNFMTNGIYDWTPYVDKIFKNLSLKEKSILDVGPGDGFFLLYFRSKGAKVIANEIKSQNERDNYKFGELNKKYDSDGNIRKVKSIKKQSEDFSIKKIYKTLTYKNLKVYNYNIYELSKINKKFDYVFCNDVFLHLTDPLRALYQLKQVAKYIILGNCLATPLDFNSNIEKLKYKSISRISRGEVSSNGIFANHIKKFYNRVPLKIFLGNTKKNAFYFPNYKAINDMIVSSGLKIQSSKIINPAEEDFLSIRPRCISFIKT